MWIRTIRFTNVELITQEVCGIFDERPRSLAYDMDEGVQRIPTTHVSQENQMTLSMYFAVHEAPIYRGFDK